MRAGKISAIGVIVSLVAIPVALHVMRDSGRKSVETENAELRVLSPSVLASGTLAYASQVTLVPEVVGRVKELLVKEGDPVARGQLLLRLDAAAYQAEVAQIDAQLRQSQLNIERQRVRRDAEFARLKRYESLRAQGMVEAVKYDDFVAQADMAEVDLRNTREALVQMQAQLKQAHERLAKTEIRAPIDGKVTSITIKAGETAVPSAISIAGSTLMVLADTGTLLAELNVDETDIARVGIGHDAKIVPAAFPEKSLAGRVESISITPRQAQGQNRSYQVKVRLDGELGAMFRPGMSCRAEVSTRSGETAPSVAVPVQAVRYEEADKSSQKARSTVLLLEDGKAVQRAVKTGTADDAYIEIVSGISRGQAVIVGPAKTLRLLHDGERVVRSEEAVPRPSAGPVGEARAAVR